MPKMATSIDSGKGGLSGVFRTAWVSGTSKRGSSRPGRASSGWGIWILRVLNNIVSTWDWGASEHWKERGAFYRATPGGVGAFLRPEVLWPNAPKVLGP